MGSTGMTQVLIAVDESESSVDTARVAYALFGDSATYIVVSVADQSPMLWGGDSLIWGVGYPIVMAPSGVVAPARDGVHSATDSEVLSWTVHRSTRRCEWRKVSPPRRICPTLKWSAKSVIPRSRSSPQLTIIKRTSS